MHEPGDILLFCLSAWKENTRWDAFKKAFDEIHRSRLGGQLEKWDEPIHFERNRALKCLAALGHIDVAYNGTPPVVIGPPVIVSLPYPGLPRAVLCGSRSPATVGALQEVCNASGRTVRITLKSQQKRSAYAPKRVELEAESHEAMDKVARSLNIAYLRTPPSWSIVTASGSVAGYIDQLEWSSQPEVNWDRKDFDPSRLAFLPAQQSSTFGSGDLRFSRYVNPVRLQIEYRLIKYNRSANVSADWARYASLSEYAQEVLLYDCESGTVAVPRSAPLPGLIARALAVCSGYAPKFVPRKIVQTSVPERYGFDVYEGVPQDVLAAAVRKLGQLECRPLSIQDYSS